jgi:prepilin-type N-terminal cleavage/methylation domain-containing protein/prepilin-type processing-associated H-X9-DG protein
MRNKRISQVHSRPACGRGAFTLIELLVVIAVIALLIAILLPTLQRVRRQGRTVVCQSNLRQWGTMFNTYMTDHDGSCWNGAWTASDTSFWLTWIESTRPYWRGDEKIRLCPVANTIPDEPRPGPFPYETFGGKTYAWGWVKHPGQPDEWFVTSSYSHNVYVADATVVKGLTDMNSVASWRMHGWTPLTAVHPGRIPVLFDGARLYGSLGDPPAFDAPNKFSDTFDDPAPYTSGTHMIMDRHDGGINLLFLDGSARKVGLKELWTFKWTRNYNTANKWTRAGGVKPEDWPAWMRRFKDY